MSTILIVEDDPNSALLLKKILEKYGKFRVIHEEDVNQILTICESKSVELVLMDISLNNSKWEGKKIDGVEITQLIKKNPDTQSIPIVLATIPMLGHGKNNLLKLSGANGFINKPILDHHSFVEFVESYLNNQPS